MMKFLSEEEAIKAKAELEKSLVDSETNLEGIDLTEYKKMLRQVYDNICFILDYYMDMSKETINITALWIIGTYFHSNFNTYPYLFANAMRGSGKTRWEKIVNAFAWQSQLTNSLTESVMFRTQGTLCIDEFEGLGGKDKNALRELLNSAYKKGTKVFRMKKKKTLEGEAQVVEEFQPYRPIVMANIWGMEEVLGDRCINITLEKSINQSKTKLVEDFDNSILINYTKDLLKKLCSVVKCSVVMSGRVYKQWNLYIKRVYTTHTTHYTYTTLNYTNYTEREIKANEVNLMLEGEDILIKDNEELFKRIDGTGLDGRYLELFLPLFLISSEIGEEILNNTLEYSKQVISGKREDELSESKDIQVYNIVSSQVSNNWVDVSTLTQGLRLILGDGENEWVNSKWLGRSLKRLNLIKSKRRVGSGMQMILDIDKAKQKMEMFRK